MNAEEIMAAVDAYISEKGIEIKFRQIPASMADNVWLCEEHSKMSQAHWHVEVWHERKVFQFQYHEGEGRFLTQQFGRAKFDEAQARAWFRKKVLDEARGEISPVPFRAQTIVSKIRKDRVKINSRGLAVLFPPKAADVFYAICRDYEARDYQSFEDWANAYGYDTDSRRAERTYNACLGIAQQMHRVLGHEIVATLTELTNDL